MYVYIYDMCVCVPCPCSHAPSCFVLLHPSCLHLSALLCHFSDLLFLCLPCSSFLLEFPSVLFQSSFYFSNFADAFQIFLLFELYNFLAFLFGAKQVTGRSKYAAKRLSLYSIDRIK